MVSSSLLDRPGEWRSGIVIVAELRDGPLEPGDVVQAIDGRPVDDWAAGRVVADRAAGETITYAVLRPAPGLGQERSVDVSGWAATPWPLRSLAAPPPWLPR